MQHETRAGCVGGTQRSGRAPRQAQAHVTCGEAQAPWKSHRGGQGKGRGASAWKTRHKHRATEWQGQGRGASAWGPRHKHGATEVVKAEAGAQVPGRPRHKHPPDCHQGGRRLRLWEARGAVVISLPLRCAHKVCTAGLHMSKTQSWTFNCKQ